MLQKSRRAIENFLRNRGVASPESRRILANQLLLALAALALGGATWWLSLWPLAFGLGAALATVNLWWIARSAQWSMSQRFRPALAFACFGGFLLRFAGTGFALYLLLVCLTFPLAPLLAGLLSAVAGLSITAVSRVAGNSCKEV